MGSPGWSLVFLMLLTITKESFATIYRGVYPFLSALVLVALLLFIFPGHLPAQPADAVGGAGAQTGHPPRPPRRRCVRCGFSLSGMH
jgi:hypothetical protein